MFDKFIKNENNICKCTKSKVAMVASWTLLQTATGPQNKCWVKVNGSYDSNPNAAENRYLLTLNCPRGELILYSVSSGAAIRWNGGKWKLLAALLQLKCIWKIIIGELKIPQQHILHLKHCKCTFCCFFSCVTDELPWCFC